MAVSSRYTEHLKQLIVIKNLAESCQKKGQAIPPAILSKLEDIGKTFSSIPNGYTWVSRMISTLIPAVRGGAAGEKLITTPSYSEESFKQISLLEAIDHIALLLEKGAFLEAKEIFNSLPESIKAELLMHGGKGTAAIRILDPSYDVTTPDPSLLLAEAENVKTYKVLPTLREMQFLFEMEYGDGIEELFAVLPSNVQKEILQLTKSMMKLKSTFLDVPTMYIPPVVDYLKAFLGNEVNPDIKAAILDIVILRQEDT